MTQEEIDRLLRGAEERTRYKKNLGSLETEKIEEEEIEQQQFIQEQRVHESSMEKAFMYKCIGGSFIFLLIIFILWKILKRK